MQSSSDVFSRKAKTSFVMSPPSFPAVLKKAFDGFDHEKKGAINCDVVATILRMMGQAYNAQTLKELIDEVDADGGFIRTVLADLPRQHKCSSWWGNSLPKSRLKSDALLKPGRMAQRMRFVLPSSMNSRHISPLYQSVRKRCLLSIYRQRWLQLQTFTTTIATGSAISDISIVMHRYSISKAFAIR